MSREGDPPDEELEGPAAYPDWLESSSSAIAHRIGGHFAVLGRKS
jgi:hypothetical protein